MFGIGDVIDYPSAPMVRGVVLRSEKVSMLDQINGVLVIGRRYYVSPVDEPNNCRWVYHVPFTEKAQPPPTKPKHARRSS